MATADINGTTVHHTEVGDGPVCLVLHGGLGYDQTIYRTLDPLAERLRLVYLDHRGNGRSGRPPIETLTMAQLADDAVALADHLGAERFIVLGHSYGGFIAQELAIRHVDRLLGLILLSTTPGQLGTGEKPAPSGPPIPPEFLAMLTSLPETDEAYEAMTRQLLPAYLHAVDAADVAPLMEGTVYDAAAVRRGFEILAQWSSVDRLGAVTVPVLLGVGRHDAITAFPQAYRIAGRLPDAEVVIYEDSGHFPWLEEPGHVFASINAWLTGHDLAP